MEDVTSPNWILARNRPAVTVWAVQRRELAPLAAERCR